MNLNFEQFLILSDRNFNNRGSYNRGPDTQRNNSYGNNNSYARNKSPGGGYNSRGGSGAGGDGYNGNNSRPVRNQHYSEENWDDEVPSQNRNLVVQPPPVAPQPTTPAARYANDDDWDE